MRALAVLVVALALAAPAAAAAEPPTLADLEDEVMCPECGTTLDRSNAPVADALRAYIQRRIDAGDSEDEIKARLVEQFGDEVLASPPKRGFSLLAWVLPIGGLLVAAVALGAGAVAWSRRRAEDDAPTEPLDAETERRLDELVVADD